MQIRVLHRFYRQSYARAMIASPLSLVLGSSWQLEHIRKVLLNLYTIASKALRHENTLRHATKLSEARVNRIRQEKALASELALRCCPLPWRG